MADLLVDQGADSQLERELIVALEDFVLWRGKRRGDDRVGIPVDIPTRNLEIVVIVDVDLYRESRLPPHEVPKLALEFRNPESAQFEGIAIGLDRWNPIRDPMVDRYVKEDPETHDEEISQILQPLSNLRARVDSLLEAKVSKTSKDWVVPPESRSRLKNALVIPDSFLYYKLSWPFPHFGVDVCIRLDKPFKVRREAQPTTGCTE